LKLQKVCNKRGVMLEYTAPGTSQQDGIVERRFITNHDRAFEMMLQCNLKAEFQRVLWAEATKEASNCTDILVNTATHKPPDMMWYGMNHWNDRTKKRLEYLQPFGRVGYVKLKRKIIEKFVEKSFKCVHVGHAEGHASDTYRMYNAATNETILTRAVKWAAWAPSKSTSSLEAIFEDKGIDDLEPVVPVNDHLAGSKRAPWATATRHTPHR
jgi:hypothetical protein